MNTCIYKKSIKGQNQKIEVEYITGDEVKEYMVLIHSLIMWKCVKGFENS